MPGSAVAANAPSPIAANTISTAPSAPRKRPARYCSFAIGAVKKKLCMRCSKSCCTARPMIAAITVTPSRPSTAVVCISASGELIAILALPNAMFASWNRPPAAAIHSMASAKKIVK